MKHSKTIEKLVTIPIDELRLNGSKFRVYTPKLNKIILSECSQIHLDFYRKAMFASDDQFSPDGHIKNIGEFNELKIMNFTNNKDENGVDIYQGDIVKLFQLNEKNKKWGGKSIATIGLIDEKYKITNLTSFNITFEECNPFIKYYVVGNIYENPELLEGNNEY